MTRFLDLKCRALRARASMIDEHQVLVGRLASAKTIEEANEVLPLLEKLEELHYRALKSLLQKAR
jgi:hypothetical protein